MTQPPVPQTAAAADAAAAFASMLATAYRVPLDATGRKALGDRELVQRLNVTVSIEFRLADWAMMRLAPEEILTPYQYGMLDVCEKVLAQLFGPPLLHAQFAEQVLQYRGVFAAAAIPADGWITNPQHPVRGLMSSIFSTGLGWQPELGTAALSIRGHVEGWLEQVRIDPDAWIHAATLARQWQEDERRRAERIERRLVESEAGGMRERRARQLAARTLNQAFADRLIGREAADMLVADWLPALQQTLLRKGEQDPVWQKVKRTTASLRWTLSPELGDDARNKLFRLITQVGEDLDVLAPEIFYDPAVRERVIGVLEHEHLCVARNLPRETVAFVPVDTHDALTNGNASLSENLLDKVRGLAPGDWLLLHEGNGTRRVRVLLKDEENRQVLLVNALGVKALSIDWEKIALALANGGAERLPDKLPISACVSSIIEDTRKLHQQAQQSRIEALRIAREQASADARIKEAARQKALAEAQALEVARQDAQRRADLADQEVSTMREGAMQRARLMASSLTIGAWLVFDEKGAEPAQRRLTVMLPSSGKYIFVDASGGNKREIMRDELIRGLGDGSIVPHSKDRKLDDALTRVVSGLRNERNPPGGTG